MLRASVKASDEPNAHFDLAQMYVVDAAEGTGGGGGGSGGGRRKRRGKGKRKGRRKGNEGTPEGDTALRKAVQHLEAAALGGHFFAMFNLGIAHLYGYGVEQRDIGLAAAWFEASGLPEGLVAKAMHSRAIGREAEATGFEERAKVRGLTSVCVCTHTFYTHVSVYRNRRSVRGARVLVLVRCARTRVI